MTNLGVVLSLALVLGPIAVFVTLRSREGRPSWLLAFDVPAAVSLDLIVTLLIARVVTLDIATWITKGLWLVGGAGVFFYRRRAGWRPRWPTELAGDVVWQCLAVGVAGLLLSLVMSRPCAIWDRQYHVPLTTSLRGQLAPFVNVYEPWKELHYHVGGDLFAASLAASSLGILHASHALSLVHDFCFFWLGVTTTLVLRRLGVKHLALLVFVFLAMLLSSPVVPLQGEHRTWFAGYSTTNFLSLSFRPHGSLAALMTLPFVALPLIRLRELNHERPLSELLIPLAICTPFMLILDEFSIGTIGLALGAVWLAYPRVFAPTRRAGLYLLGALAACFVFGILVMKGTLGPGAPHYPLGLSFPRSPGFYTPALQLGQGNGTRYFISDLLPILGVFVGGALLLIRTRDEVLKGSWLMFAVIVVVSVYLFSTLVYNGGGLQNHRFITVPMLFGPLFAAAFLAPRAGNNARLTGGAELGMVVLLVLGAASSLDWLGGSANPDCRSGEMSLDFYDTNCRAETGAGLVTSRTRPMYLDPAILYLYAGCRPAYMEGPPASPDGHDLKNGNARMGLDALREVSRNPRFLASPQDTLTVACASAPSADPACAMLKATGACQPAGSAVVLCPMSPAQREDVLKRAGK